MTSSKKVNIAPKAKTTPATSSHGIRGVSKDMWLSLTLSVLALLGAWVAMARWGSLGYLPASGPLAWAVEPAVLSTLAVVFSALFIFRSLTHRRISPVARIVAYVLVVTTVLALAFAALLSGQCDSYTSDCSTDFLFRLAALNYAYFFLPVTLSIVSVIGVVALLVDTRKN